MQIFSIILFECLSLRDYLQEFLKSIILVSLTADSLFNMLIIIWDDFCCSYEINTLFNGCFLRVTEIDMELYLNEAQSIFFLSTYTFM